MDSIHLPNITLDLIVRSSFFGFACWTFVWIFAKRGYAKKNNQTGKFHSGEVLDLNEENPVPITAEKSTRIDRVAVALIMLSGIVEMLLLIKTLPENLVHAFGEYWIGFWFYPVTYFLLPQLFWIEKIRNSGVIRVLYALWVIILLHVINLIIGFTSYHRDYIEFDHMIWLRIVGHWIEYLIIFAFLMMCGVFIMRSWSKQGM